MNGNIQMINSFDRSIDGSNRLINSQFIGKRLGRSILAGGQQADRPNRSSVPINAINRPINAWGEQLAAGGPHVDRPNRSSGPLLTKNAIN